MVRPGIVTNFLGKQLYPNDPRAADWLQYFLICSIGGKQMWGGMTKRKRRAPAGRSSGDGGQAAHADKKCPDAKGFKSGEVCAPTSDNTINITFCAR